MYTTTDKYLPQQRISEKVQLKSPHFHARCYKCMCEYVSWRKAIDRNLLTSQEDDLQLQENIDGFDDFCHTKITHSKFLEISDFSDEKNEGMCVALLSLVLIDFEWLSAQLNEREIKSRRKKKSRICISKQNSDVIIFYASEMRKNNKRNYLIFSSQHFIEIISSGNSSTSNVRRRSWLSPITSKARFERGNVRNNDLLMLSI